MEWGDSKVWGQEEEQHTAGLDDLPGTSHICNLCLLVALGSLRSGAEAGVKSHHFEEVGFSRSAGAHGLPPLLCRCFGHSCYGRKCVSSLAQPLPLYANARKYMNK